MCYHHPPRQDSADHKETPIKTIGAIFDWDGVIIDSKDHHEEAWNRLGEELGFPHTHEQFQGHFGMKNEHIIPEVLHWAQDPAEVTRLSLHKEEIYRELLGQSPIAPLDGVLNWLETLKTADVPCVIGSSTPRLNIATTIDRLGVAGYLTEMVTAEDVIQGKPNPEVFLRAADRIGIPPHRCIVFEDAPAGIQAAKAGGMKAVAVTTTHAADTLTEADRIVTRLDELKLDEIREWFDE